MLINVNGQTPVCPTGGVVWGVLGRMQYARTEIRNFFHNNFFLVNDLFC
jgi:hypothetical protein